MSRTPLAAQDYYEILSSQLVPMFSGSELDSGPITCDVSDPRILPEARGNLLVRPDGVWPFYFRLRRPYAYDDEDIRIVSQFLRALDQKLVASGQPFFQHLLSRCSEDVVAWSMQHRSMDDALLPSILDALQKWSSQTYEGVRISVAIGVDCAPDPWRISNIHLEEIINRDYAKVISNGMDTILVLSPSGHIVEHLALGSGQSSTHLKTHDPFSPIRYQALAHWAQGSRVAIALNRQGEILVFKRQCLQFAFRRGAWSHFTHRAIVARMIKTIDQKHQPKALMEAVYLSCLDISFARTGGCIAIVKPKNTKKVSAYLHNGDLLIEAKTEKASLLRHLIGLPFQKIPRPIRQEMAALDGAVVLNWAGRVIAAGAIVRVPGGSEGGGRRAAAKALSRLGLALKVSADGGIIAFTDEGTKENPEIAFEVSA